MKVDTHAFVSVYFCFISVLGCSVFLLKLKISFRHVTATPSACIIFLCTMGNAIISATSVRIQEMG